MVQPVGEARRDRALADAPFAAADCDDVGNPQAEGAPRVLAPHDGRKSNVQATAVEQVGLLQFLQHGRGDPLAARIGRRRQLDLDVHGAVVADANLLQHLELSERPADLGFRKVSQGLRNALFPLCVGHRSLDP